MRFMVLLKADRNTEAGVLPSEKLLAEMGRYNEELRKAGMLLALDGLYPPAEGASVSFDGEGVKAVTDGPFTEAKEVVGGYWIIQARSKDEAVEWAKRCPGRNCRIEVRRVFEMEDFPAEVQAAVEGG